MKRTLTTQCSRSKQYFVVLQLMYSIAMSVSNPEALAPPVLNISDHGSVPTHVQTWQVELPCTGLVAAEVDVLISVNVTLNRAAHNVTRLTFKRVKICLRGPPSRKSTSLHFTCLTHGNQTLYLYTSRHTCLISVKEASSKLLATGRKAYLSLWHSLQRDWLRKDSDFFLRKIYSNEVGKA